MNDTERLREILGNLTFIVGMAHVKGAHGEIDSDAVVARTNDEINKAESQLQTLLDEARLEELKKMPNHTDINLYVRNRIEQLKQERSISK